VGLDLSWRFDRWIRRLPSSPQDEGRVEGLVIRPDGSEAGARAQVERVAVFPERGVAGDRWAESPYATPGNEVSIINVHFLRKIAGGDPERMASSGDNLHVDLDLSQENLPTGTRLIVGSAVLEVSEVEHHPCRQFVERFGQTATKRVARANRLGLRGRGVLCHVREGGEIAAGDTITVERPSDLQS
jgi:MOSC domain-containing protein YiiM